MTTFRAPWQDPNLYPPARLKDGRMGVWHDGQVEPMTLAGIVLGVSQDLGGEKPSGPGISLVEMPGEDRVVDVVDLPEVQRAMAHHLDDSLSRDIQQQGWIAWLLGPLILAGTLAGLNIGYFSIQVITSGQTWWESLQDRRSLRTSPGEYFAALSAKRRFDYWVSRSKWHAQWRTWSLGAVFLLVFLAEVVSGLEPAVDRAALVKSEVWAGQVWRLLTAALMHGSFMHLAMNGFAWISLGVLLERVVRPSLLFPLFLLSALGGNVASLIFLPLQPSLGASGGIMGFVGFLMVLGWRRKPMLPPGFSKSMVRGVASMAVFGAVAWKSIDNAAHAGGLLTGSLAGVAMFSEPEGALPLPPSWRWNLGDILSALALAGVAGWALFLLLA